MLLDRRHRAADALTTAGCLNITEGAVELGARPGSGNALPLLEQPGAFTRHAVDTVVRHTDQGQAAGQPCGAGDGSRSRRGVGTERRQGGHRSRGSVCGGHSSTGRCGQGGGRGRSRITDGRIDRHLQTDLHEHVQQVIGNAFCEIAEVELACLDEANQFIFQAAQSITGDIVHLGRQVARMIGIVQPGILGPVQPVGLQLVLLAVVVDLHRQPFFQRGLQQFRFPLEQAFADVARVALGLQVGVLLVELLANFQDTLKPLPGFAAHAGTDELHVQARLSRCVGSG
ncbi:hypothetical protein D3C79_731640 [compost metagenome]